MFQQTLARVDLGTTETAEAGWKVDMPHASLLLRTVFLATCLAQSQLHAASFKAEGKIKYDVFLPNAPPHELEATFSASVSSNWWLISTESASQGNLVVEWYYDGTQLIMKQRFAGLDQIRAVEAKSLSEAKHSTTGNGSSPQVIRELIKAFTNNVPPYDAGLCFPIWLAFASSAYFDSVSDPEIPDLLAMGDSPINTTSNALRFEIIKKAAEDYWLPEQVKFYSLGIYVVQVGDEAKVQRWWPPFSSGFLRGFYQVEEWGDPGSKQYPLSSTLEVFSPSRDATNANQTTLTTRSTIETAAFRTIPESEMPAPAASPGELATVRDYRLKTRYGSPIEYIVTNQLLQVGDPRLLQVQLSNEQREQRMSSLATKASKAHRLSWLMFAIVALSPLIVLQLRSKKQKPNPLI